MGFQCGIVGLPNVGKSTIFNRLSNGARSLVFDRPHVTRDPIEDTVNWNDKTYRLIDTGGVPLEKKNTEIDLAVRKSIEKILEKTNIIIVICGVHTPDKYLSAVPGTVAEVSSLILNLKTKANLFYIYQDYKFF